MKTKEQIEFQKYRKTHGPLLNPRLDFVFKSLFTDGSVNSQLALKGIISAATGRTVTDATVVNTEPPALSKADKRCSFDVSTVFNDGERAEIEMQGQNVQGAFADRITYLAARLMVSNFHFGEDYSKLKYMYQISITDFNLTKGTEVLTRYRMYSPEKCVELGNSRLNIITLELPKVIPLLKQDVKTLSKPQMWCIFLKKADDSKYQDLIKKICLREESIMAAQEKLKVVSMEEPEWLRQFHEDKARMDYISSMNYAKRTGLERGIRKGIQQGLKQAREQLSESKKQIARNLKQMGLTGEQIAQATGLDLQEVALL